MAKKEKKEWFTVSEVAKELGYSRQTVLAWINKGKIHAIRPDKEYRIPASEIKRLTQKSVEKK